jgi:hypothetical protein
MKERLNRKKLVVYEPNYTPGKKYKTVNSWFQAKKLCREWGSGCEVWVQRLSGGARLGHINYWHTEKVFEFTYT